MDIIIGQTIKKETFNKVVIVIFMAYKVRNRMLVLVAQSSPTLCDPMDCCPPGSSVHGDSPGEKRILEWVAMPFPRGSSQPGIKPRSLTSQVDSLPAELPGKPHHTPDTVFVF